MIPFVLPSTYGMDRLLDSQGRTLVDSQGYTMYAFSDVPGDWTRDLQTSLPDALDCKANWEKNKRFDLELTYPVDGYNFELLKEGNYIVASAALPRLVVPEVVEDRQPFRIKRITTPLNGKVTVYAEHAAYLLDGIIVPPYTAYNSLAAVSGITGGPSTYVPFNFGLDENIFRRFRTTVPMSIWSIMGGQEGSILDVYGGEWLFDWWHVSLKKRIGKDNGVSINYAVNLKDFSQDFDMDNCYTSVIAYWGDADHGITWGSEIQTPGTHPIPRTLPLDATDQFDVRPSVYQLDEYAESYITTNRIWEPAMSWEIDFVPLETTQEYRDVLKAMEYIDRGDDVKVHVDRLGIDIQARVCATVWDVLNDRYKSLTLGNKRKDITDTIAKQTHDIAQIKTRRGRR